MPQPSFPGNHLEFPGKRPAVGGGTVPAVWRLGGRTGLEHCLDGGGNKLRGLRVDDDVPAEQHAADDPLSGRVR
jgi:hypothetical protein